MIGNFSLCGVCDDLIEKRKGIWWTVAYDTCVGPEEGGHKHFPANPDVYDSTKYGSDIRTEILSVMADMSFETTALGETESFGYYELFADLCAIVEYDSQGFVYSTIYDTEEMARAAWSHIETDYEEWCEEQDEQSELDKYGEPCDCGAITYVCDCP